MHGEERLHWRIVCTCGCNHESPCFLGRSQRHWNLHSTFRQHAPHVQIGPPAWAKDLVGPLGYEVLSNSITVHYVSGMNNDTEEFLFDFLVQFLADLAFCAMPPLRSRDTGWKWEAFCGESSKANIPFTYNAPLPTYGTPPSTNTFLTHMPLSIVNLSFRWAKFEKKSSETCCLCNFSADIMTTCKNKPLWSCTLTTYDALKSYCFGGGALSF